MTGIGDWTQGLACASTSTPSYSPALFFHLFGNKISLHCPIWHWTCVLTLVSWVSDIPDLCPQAWLQTFERRFVEIPCNEQMDQEQRKWSKESRKNHNYLIKLKCLGNGPGIWTIQKNQFWGQWDGSLGKKHLLCKSQELSWIPRRRRNLNGYCGPLLESQRSYCTVGGRERSNLTEAAKPATLNYSA